MFPSQFESNILLPRILLRPENQPNFGTNLSFVPRRAHPTRGTVSQWLMVLRCIKYALCTQTFCENCHFAKRSIYAVYDIATSKLFTFDDVTSPHRIGEKCNFVLAKHNQRKTNIKYFSILAQEDLYTISTNCLA